MGGIRVFAAALLASAATAHAVSLPPRTGASTHTVVSRDFFSKSQDFNDEGEAHGEVDPPEGADFTSVRINGVADVAVFRSDDVDDSDIQHAYVVIHGKLRNGDEYWTTMDKAVRQARADDYPGANRSSVVVAPQFFSEHYNSGQYDDRQLAFADLNDWQDAGVATHPAGTDITSIDALDAIVADFANATRYPRLANVTVLGHGGGGQLAQRYSAIAADPPSGHVHVRYIHGDPSSTAYFTDDRPARPGQDLPTPDECIPYHSWRYGFDRLPESLGPPGSGPRFFRQYVSRDVVSLVGYQDTNDSGDQSCMGRMQGGDKRRDRNLTWYKYVNMLARTREDVDDFPGVFDPPLPDWSHLSGGESKVRLVVVKDAEHDVAELLASDDGRSALFSDGDVAIGWRPSPDTFPEGSGDYHGSDSDDDGSDDDNDDDSDSDEDSDDDESD